MTTVKDSPTAAETVSSSDVCDSADEKNKLDCDLHEPETKEKQPISTMEEEKKTDETDSKDRSSPKHADETSVITNNKANTNESPINIESDSDTETEDELGNSSDKDPTNGDKQGDQQSHAENPDQKEGQNEKESSESCTMDSIGASAMPKRADEGSLPGSSIIGGNEESKSIPKSGTSSVDLSPAEIPSSEQGSLETPRSVLLENYQKVQVASEPPNKKLKKDSTAEMPQPSRTSLCPPSGKPLHQPSLSHLQDNFDQNKRHETEHNSYLILQSCLRERQMIRGELSENQEILVMRQERLARLEAEYRLFQERQVFVSSEQWLTEKILRQEELFENRELLGIQQQRCQRLQNLLELNERQMLEQRSVIEREKLKVEAIRGTSKVNTIEAVVNDNTTGDARAIMEAEIRKQIANHQIIDQNLALDVEMKRRFALEQKTAREQEIQYRLAMERAVNRQAAIPLEHKTAMEQEIQYRLAMERAVKRQAAMQQAIDARKIMMMQNNAIDMTRHLSVNKFPETSAISTSIPNATVQDVTEATIPVVKEAALPDAKEATIPDVTGSMSSKDVMDKEEIVIGATATENYQPDAEEEDDDDESIVI